MRTEQAFDTTFLAVKTTFVENMYMLANARKRGKNIQEPFNADVNLINILDDNDISQFLTVQQSNKILDKLVP